MSHKEAQKACITNEELMDVMRREKDELEKTWAG